MAKLDQSFIKAYGQFAARPAAGHVNPAARDAAAVTQSVISAAPIVIDTSSFSVDATCASTCDQAQEPSTLQHRFEAAPQTQSSAPRPHRRTRDVAATELVSVPTVQVGQPKKTRRTTAKREMPAIQEPPASMPLITTFQADSLTVDTPAARHVPAATPKLAAKPAPKPPAKTESNPLCHRACTVQFSTVADTQLDNIECDDEPLDDIESEEIPHEETAPFRYQPASVREPAPHAARIDGAAYHRVTAPVAPAVAAATKPTLRSGYEVDAFRWPEVVNGLAGRATTALSTLIDELVDASSDGRGVIMFAGERRGAGATTLAIYAARRMAELGLSVALVDADFGKPFLARSLGMAVEHGWDDALQAQTGFAAAMISSLEDGVTVLPCRNALLSVTGAKAARMAEDLSVLRKHFALVLLDGGPLAEVAEPWLKHAPEDTIDCGIVVRDVRLDAGRRGPARPHTPHATYPAIGVVENFVSENQTISK